MKFVLFEKLAELATTELIMLICAVVIVVAIVVAIVVYNSKKAKTEGPINAQNRIHTMVIGALCVSLSFMLSYIKLFSMPLGGSITLCSMLPITMYACWYGPKNGFIAALAYGVLQVIQGAWIVHWAQFILDYFVAFSCFGLAAFFPKKLPLGVAVAGISRMLVSTISGIVFFASSAADAGYSSVVGYSLLYNASTIGIDTIICVVVALLPPMAKLFERLKPKAA
ncbi:MAG: energy-coupled thiamine transporter ThiT [Clostridia bacterium]